MATNIRQLPSSVATSLSDSGKGKEKLGESSSSSGSVGGRSVRLFSRDSGSTSWNEGSLSARGSRSGSDAPGIRHRSVEIGGSAGRQYGLKFFDRLKPGGDGVAMPTLGRQFDPVADKGLKLGP